MVNQAVGERVRQARKRLGLTQAQFAERLGVIKGSVARYEAGRIPRTDVLDNIARLSGVTTPWLLHGEARDESRPRPIAGEPLGALGRELLDQLQAELRLETSLPLGKRDRYRERIKEISARIRRELAEYRTLLEAEHRTERAKRRSKETRQRPST
jgi:transcriptional regulator with XRE-family HTH domain